MEAKGFMKRLKELQISSKRVKIIFQYPSSNHAIIKSGKVIECYEDSFLLDEKFDGMVVYSYRFIVEVKEVKQNGM